MSKPANHRIGQYLKVTTAEESFKAYLPPELPPDPPVSLEGLEGLYERAIQILGRFDGMMATLPDTSLFLYMYVRKEAVLSSQIEGTQSSFSDLLLYEEEEAPGVPLDDVEEVSQYVAAMNHGVSRIQEGFPLSLRLLREIHGILMASGRGSDKLPGEFRRSQNWVGGSRPGNAFFVPPPPEHLMTCLDNLEKFLHDEKMPTLLKAAIGHVQFETIHPFLDGNGRLGRLLIPFILMVEGMLTVPGLYLSLHFKKNRPDYYRHLQEVREAGAWEAWLEFFLTGVVDSAQQGYETAQKIVQLFEADQRKIETLKRAKASALNVFQYLQKHPLISAKKAAVELKLSFPTVTASIQHLIELRIISEVTGKQRDRLYVYQAYLTILQDEG
ncbi:MAG: Fic family protein [Vampirovibrionales bacterium]|nr:Fic family protein [Vampirovibrionales bacterium]